MAACRVYPERSNSFRPGDYRPPEPLPQTEGRPGPPSQVCASRYLSVWCDLILGLGREFRFCSILATVHQMTLPSESLGQFESTESKTTIPVASRTARIPRSKCPVIRRTGKLW